MLIRYQIRLPDESQRASALSARFACASPIKLVPASNKDFKPEGRGPALKVKAGTLPPPFPEVADAAREAALTALTASSGLTGGIR